jgi:hypothetical protein
MKHRKFKEAILFEKDGSLNLSQLILCILTVMGVVGFLTVVVIHPANLAVQLAAFGFLVSTFLATLIASIPIDKAKILAESKLPSDAARAITGIQEVTSSTSSTDLQEGWNKEHKKKDKKEDIG